jgi:hypothetical protein
MSAAFGPARRIQFKSGATTMRSPKVRHPPPEAQTIRRISGREAGKMLDHLEGVLAGFAGNHASDRAGFPEFVATLSEDVLRLAIQPDSWGERARARLISVIAPSMATIDEIAQFSSIVMACFLLEIGNRRGHVNARFPHDLKDPECKFSLSCRKSNLIHVLGREQILRLVASCGPDLVSLCYFGDEKSLEQVEIALKADQRQADSILSVESKQ